MAKSPSSPLPDSLAPSEFTSKRIRQCTQLRRLTSIYSNQLRPVVHVNPSTEKALGPLKENFHTYLGIVAQERLVFCIPTGKLCWNL